jgi:hypothetical protein
LRRARAAAATLEELERRLLELPDDREIVVYCRCPYCAFAHQAVRQPMAAAYVARRLADGWPEWHLAQPPARAAIGGPADRGGDEPGGAICAPRRESHLSRTGR